jgi:hypothetical protein
MVRGVFAIESSQQIQYLNCWNSTVIALDRSEPPERKFRQLKLATVGVKRVYSAG